MIVVAGAVEEALQGFSRGQGTTAFRGAEFVDIPVPGSWWACCSRRHSRFLARTGFNIVQWSRIFQHSSSSESWRGREVFSVYAQTRIQLLHPRALMPWMRLLQGFFALFPTIKKSAGLGSALGGRNWVRTLIHGLRRLIAESMAGADDEFEAERVEEDAATRFAAGFRPMRGLHAVPRAPAGAASVGSVSTAIDAPSRTHGLSFTRKPQPMNISSHRTFLTEAVEAASGPGERWPGRRGGRRRCVASFRPGSRSSSHR